MEGRAYQADVCKGGMQTGKGKARLQDVKGGEGEREQVEEIRWEGGRQKEQGIQK